MANNNTGKSMQKKTIMRRCGFRSKSPEILRRKRAKGRTTNLSTMRKPK